MPRRRGPRTPPPKDLSGLFGGAVRTERYAGRAYTVRALRGNGEGRSYLCPGCSQQLPSSLPHVVVWPADGLSDVSDRRHWHTGCWAARERRPPLGSWL